MNTKSIKYRKVLKDQLSRGVISEKKYTKELKWIRKWEKDNIK